MKTSQQGFTLAELLIALALLGIIAAFTIPKVLQASGTKEAQAKVREAVSTLEQAWYNKKMQNAIVPGATNYLGDNISSLLNTTSMNTTRTSVFAAGNPMVSVAATHPCAVVGGPETADYAMGWFQFANGVLITGIESGTPIQSVVPTGAAGGVNTNLCIDTNGPAGPNVVGQDVFIGNFNQYGVFNGAAASDPNAKNFNWGNNSGVWVNNGAGAGTASLDSMGGAGVGRAGSQLG